MVKHAVLHIKIIFKKAGESVFFELIFGIDNK